MTAYPVDHRRIRDFMDHSYRHFNARTVVEAAEAWVDQLDRGNRMFLTLAGAMSTAEVGISIAELIRQDKIHGICCTGANLEEDLFNAVAHDDYQVIASYRDLSPADEYELLAKGMNRVTDTCNPEAEAMRTGLTLDELRSRSFAAIVAKRTG